MPQDLKAINSLSTESLPKDIIDASNIAIGIVSARMKGKLNPKIDTIVKTSRCFSIIRFKRSIAAFPSMRLALAALSPAVAVV